MQNQKLTIESCHEDMIDIARQSMQNRHVIADDTPTYRLLHDIIFVTEDIQSGMQRMKSSQGAQYSAYWSAAELANYALELMRRFTPEELKTEG